MMMIPEMRSSDELLIEATTNRPRCPIEFWVSNSVTTWVSFAQNVYSQCMWDNIGVVTVPLWPPTHGMPALPHEPLASDYYQEWLVGYISTIKFFQSCFNPWSLCAATITHTVHHHIWMPGFLSSDYLPDQRCTVSSYWWGLWYVLPLPYRRKEAKCINN